MSRSCVPEYAGVTEPLVSQDLKNRQGNRCNSKNKNKKCGFIIQVLSQTFSFEGFSHGLWNKKNVHQFGGGGFG